LNFKYKDETCIVIFCITPEAQTNHSSAEVSEKHNLVQTAENTPVEDAADKHELIYSR
jgi:hypothetical protein